MKIDILRKQDISPAVQQQVTELFKQLNATKKQMELARVLENDSTITMAYCEEDGKILGIASMCCYLVISGKKGWIEDVVVDTEARGRGIGRKLMEKLMEEARALELTELLLFTEDHRLPAIKLYRSLGFNPKATRIYSIKDL